MPYECKKCGRVFQEKPIEHGVFIVSWLEPAGHETCDGEIIEISYEEYIEKKDVIR